MAVQNTEATHKIVLFRIAHEQGTVEHELNHLRSIFSSLPVSIYVTDHPVFDFALIGSLPEDFVTSEITNARVGNGKRYEPVHVADATRYLCHGNPVDPAWPHAGEAIKKRYDELDIKALHDPTRYFHGMMLFRSGELSDEAMRGRIHKAIESSFDTWPGQWSKDFCLSNITWSDEGENKNALKDSNCWMRFFCEIRNEASPISVMRGLHDLHIAVRNGLASAVGSGADKVSQCFPVVLNKLSPELPSREIICRNALQRFEPGAVEMVWFDFSSDNAPHDPNIRLPLGNFVVSAAPGTGKTNAALAIVSGFGRWRREPGVKYDDLPNGQDRFDVVYLNLKSREGAAPTSDAASEGNEARLFKAFVTRKSLGNVECVRPVDLKRYLESQATTSANPAFAYVEPDGRGHLSELFKEIMHSPKRRTRGLLVVVDEAFDDTIAGAERDDIHSLYNHMYNQGRSNAVRYVLIGQAIAHIKAQQRDIKFLAESTLLIGPQEATDEVREAIAVTGSEEDALMARYLRCADTNTIKAMAEDFERRAKSKYRIGAVIVRPFSSGTTRCHAIPCHIRPEVFPEAEKNAVNINWWEPSP